MQKVFAAVLLAGAATVAFAQQPAAPAKPPMKKMDPAVMQCQQENGKHHAALMQQHAAASKAGRIGPNEEKAFQAMEQRLGQMRAALAKDGLTLQECQAIGQRIVAERNTLTNMAMTKGDEKMNPLQACVAQNRNTAQQISAMYQAALKDHRISPAEQKEFQEMGKRIGEMQKASHQDGKFTLEECQKISKQMAADRMALQKMASSPNAPTKK